MGELEEMLEDPEAWLAAGRRRVLDRVEELLLGELRRDDDDQEVDGDGDA